MKTRCITFLLAVLGMSSGLLAQTSLPETRAVRAPKTFSKRIVVAAGQTGSGQ